MEKLIQISVNHALLEGMVKTPPSAKGIVLLLMEAWARGRIRGWVRPLRVPNPASWDHDSAAVWNPIIDLFLTLEPFYRQLCRYIHHNPVPAAIVKMPREYEWSSYRSYAGLVQITKYFSIAEQRKDMLTFIEEAHRTEIDSLSTGAFFKPLRQDELEGIFTPSRCLMRLVVDRSYYLGLPDWQKSSKQSWDTME